MKSLSALSVSVVLAGLLICLTAGAVQADKADGPAVNPADLRLLTWDAPDGTLIFNVPASWEPNPTLAEDNGALGFLHPAGMVKGQDVPIWILMEYRAREDDVPFHLLLDECLEEGKMFEYYAQDTLVIQTMDDHKIANYHFNPDKDGAERALAFLETPHGAILFRQWSDNADLWKEHTGNIQAMLKSIRFLPPKEE